MTTAIKTPNLNLPQYGQNDLFDLKEINDGYKEIDRSYKEINDNYENALLLGSNGNVELVDARIGESTLGNKIRKIDTKISEIISKLSNREIKINAIDLGLDKTGVSDNSALLNECIRALSLKGGGTILFPSGIYKVVSQIVMLPNVILEGAMTWKGKDKGGYTVFNCYSLTSEQFLMREYTGLKNMTFNYPDQVASDSTTPIQYNWTIATDITKVCDDIQLEHLFFPNSYKAISLVRAGRFNLNNIYGQPINRGILFDSSWDMNNVNRVEFWTFTYYTGTRMYDYIIKNAIAFEFKTCDGIIASNMFCYGYKKGFYLNGSVWATFTGCCTDKCDEPIHSAICNIVEFLGGTFIGNSYDNTIVKINDVGNSFKMIGCNLYGDCSIGVVSYSNRGKVLIDCNFKKTDNMIYTSVINSGTGEMVIRKNSLTERIYGTANTIVDGVRIVNMANQTLVKTIDANVLGLASNQYVTALANGIRYNMGATVSGERIINGQFRIDDDVNIPTGIYNLSFDLLTSFTSNRKNFLIQVIKDDGTIYNSFMYHIPVCKEKTKINIPMYLGNKPAITNVKFILTYYDEPVATSDLMELTDIKLHKQPVKNNLNSSTEYLYMNTYKQQNAIDYTINK